MREILPALHGWLEDGTAFALATVVGVEGSAPRHPGAALAVAADGRVVGSVSGGCVEGAVYEAAAQALQDGVTRSHDYGVDDDEAYEAGLTCGGTLHVLVVPYGAPGPRAVLAGAVTAIGAGEPVAVLTVTGGEAELGATLTLRAGRVGGTLGDAGLDAAATEDARGLLAQGANGVRRYATRGGRRCEDPVTVLVQTFAPPPRMLVFGAIDYASATARIGAFLGYRVTVCDARPAFATPERFPDADEVVRAWPHTYLAGTAVDERTVICVLTHDPKFDIPLLVAALRTPAAYIGVMGSRRTHDDRVARLREEGVGDADLRRLASPIGLDLGARTPEETAVSIAAEIVAARWGGTGRPLTGLTGDIHRPAEAR
ncbi:XdhC family protein [Streptantibioticus silvisoli]|uniref:XdhC family protein n=1 Tax=Streptantibioticus silvisoli TaxID=2705255 RepID=A0ABT6VU62_9ACTN|nr:XdhC/CoxI family protein [Streptantibioticus silvisoli]MDI5961989.1 XdhC family protein [Streptantibioticus silvisoli]